MNEVWLGLVLKDTVISSHNSGNQLIYGHQHPIRIFHQQVLRSGFQFLGSSQRTQSACPRPKSQSRDVEFKTEDKEPVWVLVLGGKLPLPHQELYNRNQTNGRQGKGFRLQRHFMKLHIQCLTFSDLLFEVTSLMCFSIQHCFLCQLRDDGRVLPSIKLYYCFWEFLLSCT